MASMPGMLSSSGLGTQSRYNSRQRGGKHSMLHRMQHVEAICNLQRELLIIF